MPRKTSLVEPDHVSTPASPTAGRVGPVTVTCDLDSQCLSEVPALPTNIEEKPTPNSELLTLRSQIQELQIAIADLQTVPRSAPAHTAEVRRTSLVAAPPPTPGNVQNYAVFLRAYGCISQKPGQSQ